MLYGYVDENKLHVWIWAAEWNKKRISGENLCSSKDWKLVLPLNYHKYNLFISMMLINLFMQIIV